MSDHGDISAAGRADAAQHPHVPGQDPLGTGLPRQMDFRLATTPTFDEDAAASTPESGDDDAPLGGSETTEEQLTADTAVEEDALKALDPDDTPA